VYLWGYFLLDVGCRLLAIGFRVSLSVVVVRSWLSGVVYRVLVVDCRLSTFPLSVPSSGYGT
jgi:hypothetical protein